MALEGHFVQTGHFALELHAEDFPPSSLLRFSWNRRTAATHCCGCSPGFRIAAGRMSQRRKPLLYTFDLLFHVFAIWRIWREFQVHFEIQPRGFEEFEVCPANTSLLVLVR